MELDDGEIVVVDAEGSMTSEASLGQHVLLARGHDGIYGIPNSRFDGGAWVRTAGGWVNEPALTFRHVLDLGTWSLAWSEWDAWEKRDAGWELVRLPGFPEPPYHEPESSGPYAESRRDDRPAFPRARDRRAR